ncbi:MoxR family ATPase [Paenibacillaceae bacterium]|nr:MoxR family ATPase [Paenibacillaceae bacterium]
MKRITGLNRTSSSQYDHDEGTADNLALLQQMQSRIADVLLGKEEVIARAMSALLAGGHILLEDVPGVGKTMLAGAFARTIGGDFSRIQLTSDMQPYDVTGGSVWDAGSGKFTFQPGPIMSHVVLADELNRTSPRTQSALLEAMEERTVTVDGTTRRLPQPFMLLATQNPLHDNGTFPLPAAQMDRFMMRLSLGYPRPDDEIRMLENEGGRGQLALLTPIVSTERWLVMQHDVMQVHVQRELLAYVVEIAAATRHSSELALGASPRASRDWVRSAQATAYMEGRNYVVPDDLKATAVSVLAHRLMLHARSEASGSSQETLLTQIMAALPLDPGSSGRRRTS